MDRSVPIKLAVLTPIVFATWFLTSQIMGRRPVGASTALPQLTATKALDDGQQAIPGRPLARMPVATFHLTGHTIVVQGNNVHVTATVDLMNRSFGAAHLWRLRAYREGDGAIEFDKPYTEQLFEMNPSGRMSPAFSEVLQLPQGKHRVVLTLYAIPKGYDLKELNDEDKAAAAILIQVPRIVEVF
jgi:hypothetical protein